MKSILYVTAEFFQNTKKNMKSDNVEIIKYNINSHCWNMEITEVKLYCKLLHLVAAVILDVTPCNMAERYQLLRFITVFVLQA